MKKNKDILKFGVLALLAVCLVTGTITGTYAKYVSKNAASDTITVARWSFNVNDSNIAKENFNFNIFKDKTTIAPNDSGDFTFTLENTSEVDATYNIDYSITNSDKVPVKFSTDNGTTWTDKITNVQNVAIAKGESSTVKVLWKWESDGDSSDTAFGTKDTLSNVTVKATVTAIQAI